MAVGAERKLVRLQFLTEALLLSLGGGLVGILGGVGLPLLVRYSLSGVNIPVSWVAVLIAFLVSSLCGIVFGIIPAERASHLNLTEALQHE
jgi:putative ABC transport system permease protein